MKGKRGYICVVSAEKVRDNKRKATSHTNDCTGMKKKTATLTTHAGIIRPTW